MRYRETIDAVANGILDGDLTVVSYFSGRDPVFAVIGDLIAATTRPIRCRPSGARRRQGGAAGGDGRGHGGEVDVIGRGPYAEEALVATKPIRTVEDFEGVKIRSPRASPPRSSAPAPRPALPFSRC